MFREEWKKKLVASAVVLSFAILAFFGKTAVTWVRGLLTGARNINDQQALRISRNYLGNNVVAAVPFRNVGDKAQYIAAVLAVDGIGRPAFLLVGEDGKYEAIKLNPDVVDGEKDELENPKGLFGVVDIEGDGNKLVYTIYRWGGSGGYTVKVGLYDGRERVAYSVEEGGEYGDLDLLPEFSQSASARPAIRKWLADKAKELVIARADLPGYVREANLWRQTNGAHFKAGLVHIQEFPGRIPDTEADSDNGDSIGCKVEDARFQWISFFKGGVFGYDKERNVHFAVWIPDTEYHWIRELTSGDQYLWFGHDSKQPIAAFDKKEHVLHDHPRSITETEWSNPSSPRIFDEMDNGRLVVIKETEFLNPSRCE